MDDNQNDTGGSLSRVMQWASHPFKSGMGVGGWLLFTGLILCAIAAWSRLITHFDE